MDVQLEHGNWFAFNHSNLDVVRLAHQCFCNRLYYFLRWCTSAPRQYALLLLEESSATQFRPSI
jgi:hypothetical protein